MAEGWRRRTFERAGRAWRAMGLAGALALAACGGDPAPQQPPQIESAPQAQTVDDGQPATFSVGARGEQLRYRWQRDGADLAGATGATLTLPAVTLADSGARFAVVVSNDAGSATSAAATLTVRPVAPSIATAPLALSVTEGASAGFGVTAAGSAPFTYQWLRDGAEIAGATAASYAFVAGAGDHGARFSVRVTNVAGSVTSVEAVLSVTAAPVLPRIDTAPRAVTVAVGQSATFEVVASGSAPLAYEWRRNGSPVAGANADRYTTPAVTLADNGALYSVVVSNAAGSVTSDAVALGVSAATARLPAGSTDRYLSNQLLPTTNALGAGPTGETPYVVDPLAPATSATLPGPALQVPGGVADAVNGRVTGFGMRHLLYATTSGVMRVGLDRKPTFDATPVLSDAGPLAVCDSPYKFMGPSADGRQLYVFYLGDRANCLNSGNWYVRNVGPDGGVPVLLPGAPIELTWDAGGLVDGVLTWSGVDSLAYVEIPGGRTTAVTLSGAAPASGGTPGTTGPSPDGAHALRTRGGVLMIDAGGQVWRFDKATRSLSAPLLRKIGTLAWPSTGPTHVMVHDDSVLVAGLEAFRNPVGGALSSGDPVIWRIADDAGAAVRELARGGGLDLNDVHFTRNHVVFADSRAAHVAVSRQDGSLRWSGPAQVTGVEKVATTPLSDTVFFYDMISFHLASVALDTLQASTLPALMRAAEAVSDEVPLHQAVVTPFRGPHLPYSHLLAWRPTTTPASLRGAELVWVDMATGEVVAVSGRLPDAAYDSAGLLAPVMGHQGLGQASISSSGTVQRFTFGIGADSLKTFTAPR